MAVYTDIAAEFYPKNGKSMPRGVQVSVSSLYGLTCTRVQITRSGLLRPKGTYLTLDTPDFARIDEHDEACVRAVACQLRRLLPEKGAVLAAGIGNRSVTADALGPAAADGIFVTRHLCENSPSDIPLRSVAAFSPGVAGETGFSAAELLQSAVSRFAPAAVLVIDSLCTADARRLGCSVQLSDAGLFPRSAPPLTRKTLGVPVVALGVPTVMEHAPGAQGLVVTPREIDAVIRHAAALLSLAINKALQPALTVKELSFLTS